MISHVAKRVEAATDQTALVGPESVYGALGYRVVEDSVDNFGPVAGILAALEDSSSPRTLVIACDLPNVRPELLEMLFRRAESANVDAVVPIAPDGREQPLCAVYGKGAVEPLRQAVKTGVHKVKLALGGLSTAYLLPPEFHDIDPSGEMLLNVNRPEDLLKRR